MKAMRLFEATQVENAPMTLVDQPIPQPGSGQIRLNINVCGACHTDLHIVEGDIKPPQIPITPGHQVIGIIDEIGDSVEQFAVGDRIGIPWFYDACGTCDFCKTGYENLCPSARFTGFHVDGGYAEYMLAESAFALPIPDAISDDQAAPLLCAGIIGYRSIQKADALPGERIGLFGFGASAHLAIQVLTSWHCEVFVFTRSEGHKNHALELGASWVGGAEESIPKPLDRAIIFAPAGWIVHEALEKLRPAGTLAINAIHMSSIPEMPYELIYGERTLRSVANATYQDGVDFLQLAVEIPIRATVSIYPLEDANRALSDIKHSRINGEALLKI
jgi:propanol-preferring alcohol dehydrogenase